MQFHMDRSVELIKKDKSLFIGITLNNLSFKNGYGYYFYSENSPSGKTRYKS